MILKPLWLASDDIKTAKK